uniref:Bromodomain adjacent to zinc finger domain protein 1A n=1 Tax=Callorhinchus milii TaxID=7868 RepID=A0A4W3GNH2_CALMI
MENCCNQLYIFLWVCKLSTFFSSYSDFFERTILCNSLVWSCAITGKPGLTYQEALESESRARQNLQNFPGPLVVPILYLTTLTHCSRLHELCDDIYTYTKDRYFAGEIIEVTNTNGTRQTCKILEVVTPPVQNGTANGHISNRAEDVVIVISDESDNEDGSTSSAHAGKKKSKVDVSLFKYKVKPLKSEGNEIIIKAAQMNRKKNVYSRDKLKLFLKQHCELRHSLLKVKSTTATKYKLSEQNFSHLFPDDPLAFPFSPTSRGRGRVAKHRGSFSNVSRNFLLNFFNSALAQFALDLKKRKAEVLEAKKKEKEDKEKKREELKKILEEEKLKRKEEKERLKLEKEKVREKLREEKKKYAEYLKEWNKPREDMECEDLKELPSPMPVKTRLPSELFGDALMVLEFLNAFGELFDLQDEFPDGMTLEMLEEALVGNDTEGPLCELLFFFLSAIFQAHAEEEEEVAKEQLKEADTKDLTEALDEDADSTKCAVSAVAAFAAAWPQLYQGCTLRDLDLDSCTLSEILRLHILAAGADVTPANAKYRYQQQGGFDATDNACVELRLNNPGLLKKLSNIPVYDLTAADKLKLLQALCGQLLTLVSTRDFIEDNVEILKQARQEFRELKAEQHRKEREEAAARYRKKKEERLKEQEQKIKEKHDQLKEEEQRNSKATCLRIFLFKSTGRKSLNELKDTPSREETEESGTEKREMLAPEEEEVFKREQQRKEKEMWEKIQIASSCTNIVPLGRDRLYRRYWVLNSVPGLFVEEDFEGLTEDMLQPYPVDSTEELHKPVNKPNRWCVYSSPEQLDQLIEALNSRGKRESCLKESLHQEKTRLTERLTNFPVERFSIPVESKSARNSFKSAHNTNDASQLSAEKQLELRLKDLLLDIEDRTWQGTLGGIKVLGRDVWRAALESAHYALLGEAIPTQNGVRVLENDVKENGAMKIENEEANDGMNIKSGSKDRLCELKTEARSIVSTNASTPQPVNLVVRYLAIALLHLERGIERKFLKPPLDASDGGKVQKTLLDRWRESLTASTSLAQVFLHLSTLDRSILWAKSLLNARCKICHKKGDAENMLLCDGCDRGHHTYCLRPKIKTIPEDDWFCPECRPKQRFRRPSARQRPALDSEEEVFEELEEMEDEEEESEEEEETEVEDDETEEEQLRRGRTRVKLQVKSKSGKGSATTVAHGQGTEPRRYPSRSRSNTPKLTLSGAKKRRGKKVGRPKSLPNAEVKPLARLSGRMKNSRWSEGSFIELGVPRRRRRYRKAAARSPEYGASTSCRLRRLSDLDNSQEEPVRKKRKYTLLKVTGNRRSSGRNSGIHELSVCEQLIVDLVRHEDSWPFLKLVNKAQVTDYYDIIKKPVALNIIREKLNRCQYNYASDFIDDVELMFTNCFEYNPRNTSEAKAGMKLQAFFHNQVEKLGLPVKPANVDHPPQLAATKRSRI